MRNKPSPDLLAGLDVNKLKQMAIDLWRRGAGDTLVKVFPKGTQPNDARAIGFCTTLKYTVGRTPEQLESILGFKSGTRLQNGAEISRVDPLPAPDQFELRGYTQTPAGIPQIDGKVVNELYPPGEGVPQWNLTSYPQSGLRWLATVHPGQRFTCNYGTLPTATKVFMAQAKS